MLAHCTAEGILRTARAINSRGGQSAVSLRIAEQYINAFGRLAQKGNTVLLPANVGDPAAMVAQALAVFDNIRKSQKTRETEHESADDNEEERQLAEDSEPSDLDAALQALAGGSSSTPSTGDSKFTPKPW